MGRILGFLRLGSTPGHVLCPQIVLDPGPTQINKNSPQIGEGRLCSCLPKKVHLVALRFRRGVHLAALLEFRA